MSLFNNASADDSFENLLGQSVNMETSDPSLADGWEVKYDRQVPLEIRSEANRSASHDGVRPGVLESISVKLLLLGAEGAPSSMRLELTSEADLFFSFVHEIDESARHSTS